MNKLYRLHQKNQVRYFFPCSSNHMKEVLLKIPTLRVGGAQALASTLLVDAVFMLGGLLAHLHHLHLQQGGTPLNCVFWTDGD